MPSDDEQLTVEVLVRPGTDWGHTAGPPRPDPGAIERVRLQLVPHGLACHPTPFGLVCSGSRAALVRALGPGAAGAEPGATLPVPGDLAELVEQITVPQTPTFFP